MSNVRELKETGIPYTLTTELDQPLILERDGEAVAVLLSMAEYQALMVRQEYLTAGEAHRAANKAVFRDLVGCALSSGEPIWSPQPHPHWRVPYHFINGPLKNGPLLKIVGVDAHTGEVSLTESEREALLQAVGKLAEENATSSTT
jgi:PHD/YefM family antitoxin component YafN of YafNO toxin-antitoxin module